MKVRSDYSERDRLAASATLRRRRALGRLETVRPSCAVVAA